MRQRSCEVDFLNATYKDPLVLLQPSFRDGSNLAFRQIPQLLERPDLSSQPLR
jgi:hypothetical protein